MHSLVRCMPQGMQQATACNTCHTQMSTRTAFRCCIFVFLRHHIDLTYDMSIKSLLQRCVAPTRRAAALCGCIVWLHFYCCFLLLTCHKMRSHKPLPSLFLSSKLLAALLLNMQQKLQLQQRRPQHAATTTTTHIILQQFLADADAVPWPGGVPRGGVAGIDGDCLLLPLLFLHFA